MIALTFFFTEIDHDFIGSNVDVKTGKKYQQPQKEWNGWNPAIPIVAQEKDPSTLKKDIYKIKTDGRKNHHQRHFFICRLCTHWPDEAAIEIVTAV